MEFDSHAQAPILVETVSAWLMDQALSDATLEDIVDGCCNRMEAAGIPITRVHMSFSTLHPLYRAMGFTWLRGQGLSVEGYRHVQDGEIDRFLTSPYYHMMSNSLKYMRCRLDIGTQYEFPIFEEFNEIGLTDYLAFMEEFAPQSGKGMIGSWATDREGGFSDRDLAGLLRVQTRLAVACKMAVQNSLTKNMLTTYLGLDAGERVLNGQIRRGDGDTIRAAIIMADVRGSTDLVEKLGRQGYIETLNVFFDVVAGTFADMGGEVLSFIGDGFLAIFPCERHRKESEETAQKAITAAHRAIARMGRINEQRKADDLNVIDFGLSVHIGNVMFGNVGMEDRLTFSVFGAAVNITSRLEELNKKYHTKLIASDAFVDYCKGDWIELGQEMLRGTDRLMTVFSSDAGHYDSEDMLPMRAKSGMTDAENVILLHRSGGPLQKTAK